MAARHAGKVQQEHYIVLRSDDSQSHTQEHLIK
jgi:hypothetical protein